MNASYRLQTPLATHFPPKRFFFDGLRHSWGSPPSLFFPGSFGHGVLLPSGRALCPTELCARVQRTHHLLAPLLPLLPAATKRLPHPPAPSCSWPAGRPCSRRAARWAGPRGRAGLPSPETASLEGPGSPASLFIPNTCTLAPLIFGASEVQHNHPSSNAHPISNNHPTLIKGSLPNDKPRGLFSQLSTESCIIGYHCPKKCTSLTPFLSF